MSNYNTIQKTFEQSQYIIATPFQDLKNLPTPFDQPQCVLHKREILICGNQPKGAYSVTIQFEPTVMDKAAQECWFECLTKYVGIRPQVKGGQQKISTKQRHTLEHYECYFGVMPRVSESNNQDEYMNQNENNDKEEWNTCLQMIHKMDDKLTACKKLESYNIIMARRHVSSFKLETNEHIKGHDIFEIIEKDNNRFDHSNNNNRFKSGRDQLWEYFEGRIEKWEDIEI
ncbi:hypothetical protein RFI_32489 [Reticulomyxa filosa]|uniref:Uncharacterized protein n=1 Tax=Reticulomyxa filosa TaxID=46433 RepID=X6LTG1_RETFI|nr:hypothetical protein RFI_32489 [Reticulomyxa filosa]|eukprot:ETO04909.1 hypothetical protein RFI_32489 [Reticulomyxa filosa]